MCGILGIYQSESGSDIQQRLISGMHALKHRGPDARDLKTYKVANGLIHLGHTRLSIIDLTQAGQQPMSSRDGRYVIVFNGEIFNYKELREDLKALGCRFETESDTEVLLAAWMVWGRVCLPKLVGMFAFTLLDLKELTLTCVRDPFGIKPFFYTSEAKNFLFASEVPALIALKSTKPRLNLQRAYDYLVHGDYDSNSESFFEGLSSLPAGTLLTVDIETQAVGEIVRWWKPCITERRDISFEDAAERVRENFLSSIRMHLRSDVPIGAALSGGVDSSAIVCAMRYVAPNHPIHTFSYIAKGSNENEEKWADLVNRHVGAVAHKVVVTSNEIAFDLDDMICAQGEPFGSTSIYAQYRVYQLARQNGITVTLDGQGADEMLGGYNGYPGPRLKSLLEKGRWIEAIKFLNNWSNWPGRSVDQGLKLLMAELVDGKLYQLLRCLGGRTVSPKWIVADKLIQQGVVLQNPRHRPELNIQGRRLMSELAHSLTSCGLSALLRHGDRNSMRFSVESRVPFLTIEQVEFFLSMPENYLVSQAGQTKSLFRAAMRGIVPDVILNRKDKIGFQTPEKFLMMLMKDQIREWLKLDIGLSFLNQTEILREFEEIISGRKVFSSQVWRWINFIRWHQHFFI